MSAERVFVTSGCRSGMQAQAGRIEPRRGALPKVAMVVLASMMTASGCKSGATMTKPSWWTFGGGSGDSAKLAAAPSFSDDTRKPSETNRPYPTTSTPNGYVLSGTAAAGGSSPAPATQSAAPVGPVVYGSAPPAGPAVAAAAPQSAAPQSAAPQPGTAAPQTGPYASLAGETIPPPGQPLPPLAPMASASTAAGAMPAEMPSSASPLARTAEAPPTNAGYSNFTSATAMPSAAPVAEPPAARMADSRALEPAPGGPAVDSAAAGYAAGRYSSQSASRFSGGTPAAPASYGQPPADSQFPPADALLPPSSPPAAAPIMQPGTPSSPGLLPQSPSQPPVRRPDPGYRPFKTGSYRPSGTILADDAAPAAGAVRTASYEEPAAISVQR